MADVRYAAGKSPGGDAPGDWSQPTVQQTAGGGGHRRARAAADPAREVSGGSPTGLPRFTRAQLVLLELAIASALGGIAGQHVWTIVGVAAGAVLAVLSLVPVQRRWLYQVLGSRVRLAGRRGARRRFSGLASLAGPYQVVDVATSGASPIAVIRAGNTWALPLELRQDNVFNDDASVPLGGLASLLTIEDVSLASVRLLSLVTPAVPPAGAPAGAAPLLARGATRYCVLTLDTMLAAAALSARGGSDAAINQILRRCAMRAEEVLAGANLRLQTLDEPAAHRVLDNCLGPVPPGADPAAATTVESASGIRLGGTYSTTSVIGGSAAAALRTLTDVLPYLPGRVAATALVLTPDRHRGGARSTLLLRVSAPVDKASGQLAGQVRKALSRAGLAVQRVDGEQGELLRASTPLGLSEGMA